MEFFRSISLRRSWHDLRNAFGGETPHRWRFMALAAAATASIFLTFFAESGFKGELERPTIIYVESWPLSRSDAEIIAQQKIDYAAKLERQAKAVREAEERKERYRQVGKAFGMDVEAMEARARQQAAAEAKAKAAAEAKAGITAPAQ